jgi:hypothetical protein
MPVEQKRPELHTNQVRLMRLLSRAEKQLVETGMSSREAEMLLEPLQKLILDRHYWVHEGNSLAIFISRDILLHYLLPQTVQEEVMVTGHFYLKPLLRTLSDEGRFYLLALSQNKVRLFQGTRYHLREIPLSGAVPASRDEALKYENPGRRYHHHHTGAPGRAGVRAAVFHGQAVGVDYARANVRQFINLLSDGIEVLLAGRTEPMVLAGVNYVQPMYRKRSTYPNLIGEGIMGNPGLMSEEELHRKAWNIVEPYLHREQQAMAARFEQMAGLGRTSTDLNRVVKDAYAGKVASLFLDINAHAWGYYEPARSAVMVHDTLEPCDDDLLDFAAMHTFIHGGKIYAGSRERMPEKAPLAAILRY